MKSGAKLRIQAVKVLLITLAWNLAGLYFTISEYFILLTVPNAHENYSFGVSLLTALVTVTLGGLFIGSVEIFYFTDRFRKRTFAYTFFVKSIFYFISLVLLIMFAFLLNTVVIQGMDIRDPLIAIYMQEYLPISIIYNTINWSFIFICTQFMLHANNKYGQRGLWNTILGKYHKPTEEVRVFMFLDIRSSTTIAEVLGHFKYYELLNDFFYDITDSIIIHKGEIYQYVGDEMVISWELDKGVKESTCIKCFYHIYDTIQKRADKYMEKYHLVPSFKAGMHCGKVTVGEIGEIKKDITFTGDILNTTSRIQELCNKYKEKLLISKELLELLPHAGEFSTKEIATVNLRGREAKITIFSVKPSYSGNGKAERSHLRLDKVIG
jgi:adenylate cyclase